MVDINEIRARTAKMMADMQKRTEEAVSKLETPAQDEAADSAEEERGRERTKAARSTLSDDGRRICKAVCRHAGHGL